MKVPDTIKNIWVERMDPSVDYFSRIEEGVLIIRIYPRKKVNPNETDTEKD